MNIISQFINIESKNVFMKMAGQGPVIFVFHQSPQSSTSSMEWIAELGKNYLVIAPDTPGYGHSDPLTIQSPSVTDFAHFFVQLIDQLKITQFAVVGTHTGAAIAAKIAVLKAENTFAAFFDGFPAFEAQEAKELLGDYLPAFVPSWDASHLAWLWSRIREQTIFFPWYNRNPENRMNYDCRDPKAMQDWARDFLLAGESYCSAYAAAFNENGTQLSADVRCPALFCYHQSDPLTAHLDRLKFTTDYQKSIIIKPESKNKFALAREHFDQYSSQLSHQKPEITGDSLLAGKNIVHTVEGELSLFYQPLAIVNNTKKIINRFWLHDLTRSLASIIEHLDENSSYQEIAIDLPGHGLTTINQSSHSPKQFAKLIKENLTSCPDIIMSEGASLGYAIALAKHFKNCRVISINGYLLNDKTRKIFTNDSIPDLSPQWNGGHLQSAWQASRLSRLFWPWNKTIKSQIIPGKIDLNENSIAQQTLDWLTCAEFLPEIIKQLGLHSIKLMTTNQLNIFYIIGHPAQKIYPEIKATIHLVDTNRDSIWNLALQLK